MNNPKFWRVTVTIIVSALAVSTTPPSRAADTGGSFILKCRYSHTLSDDPIVHPYQPGASHSHDFFGNESTNAFSAYDAMTSSDTSCRLPLDTAGYWVPTPYLAGVEFHPSGRDGDMRIYYLAGGASSVKTIPAGLQFGRGFHGDRTPSHMGGTVVLRRGRSWLDTDQYASLRLHALRLAVPVRRRRGGRGELSSMLGRSRTRTL
jgi:Domain of unknown function (DUF1996)